MAVRFRPAHYAHNGGTNFLDLSLSINLLKKPTERNRGKRPQTILTNQIINALKLLTTMTTKEIEKVINNQTHKQLTKALHDKCADIAKTIRGIMYNLQIDSIDDYVIFTNHSNSGFSEDYLSVDNCSLECDSDYHFAGDYHCYTRSASREQKITFLNRAKDILVSLAEMQDDECLRISKVLDNFRN